MRLLLTLLGLTFILFANAQKVTKKEAIKTQLLTESPNFRIDSIIFYCNPYVTNYYEPIEKDYKPAWLQASLVKDPIYLIITLVYLKNTLTDQLLKILF